MKRHQPRLPRPPLLPSLFLPTSATPTSATFLSSLSSFSLRCRLPLLLLLLLSLLLLSLLLLLLLLMSSCLCRCRVVVSRAVIKALLHCVYATLSALQVIAPNWAHITRARTHTPSHTNTDRHTQIAIQLIYDIRVTKQMQLEHVPDEIFN